MNEPAQSPECQAFLEEIRNARRENPLPPKVIEKLRAHAGAFRKLMTGTGEAGEELISKFPFQPQPSGVVRPPEPRYPISPNPRMLDAIRKMREHEARAGHKLFDLLRRR